jgi:hypothetical protein
MTAVAIDENPIDEPQPAARAVADRSPAKTVPDGASPRLQRDLLLLLRECPALSHWQLETYDTARLHVGQSGRLCIEFLERQFFVSSLDAALSGLRLAEVLTLTAHSDPEGSLHLARRIKKWLDRGLLTYDMVKDKQKFYELLAPEKAAAVTRMFRARRAIAEWIAAKEEVSGNGDGI